VRKWLLVLAVVIGLGAALVAWFAVEDARQAADLDARWRQNKARLERARARLSQACSHDGLTPAQRWRLYDRVYHDRIDGRPPVLATDDPDDGAPVEEVRQAQLEFQLALEEYQSMEVEWGRRHQGEYWPGRLRAEVRRRTGW
jgi:hypothetical protein